MSQLPYERLLLAVPAAAVIEKALELTVDYTRNRKAFGQSVFDFQNTRFKLQLEACGECKRAEYACTCDH